MINKKVENMVEEWSEEALENFAEFINALREAEEQQKHMSEQEKKDNAIMMHSDRGDIYY